MAMAATVSAVGQAAEAVGVFQADGPADFEQAGEKQNDPGHQRPPSIDGVVPRLMTRLSREVVPVEYSAEH
jgi:hypothetical protein